MRWSKLKQQIEQRFAVELRNRLAIHVTRHRKSHDQMMQLWLAFDGERIADWSEGETYKAAHDYRLLLEQEAVMAFAASDAWTHARGTQFLPQDMMLAMFESLSTSIEDMLGHHHLFIRTLALADARLGKRRLRELDRDILASELEKRIFDLRMSVGNILARKTSANYNMDVDANLGR